MEKGLDESTQERARTDRELNSKNVPTKVREKRMATLTTYPARYDDLVFMAVFMKSTAADLGMG